MLGSTPPKAKSRTVGLYGSCTYSVKTKSITVLTRAIARESDFVKSARANPGVVLPIQGIGADAFSAAAGKALLVWKNGIEITFAFTGINPFVATQQALAKTAVGRLWLLPPANVVDSS